MWGSLTLAPIIYGCTCKPCHMHELGVYVFLLQFRVEIFASLQVSPQHCSLWMDSCVLLRPAQQVSDRRGESLHKVSKFRTRCLFCIPVLTCTNTATIHINRLDYMNSSEHDKIQALIHIYRPNYRSYEISADYMCSILHCS